MKPFIDPEFSALIDAVSGARDGELEQAVIADGKFLNPVILWKHKNTLLDGHRRWRIHIRHPGLSMPKAVVLDLETRQDAHDWIIRHQLSKRNITDEQRRYLIGKLYLDHKPEVGANQHNETILSRNGGSATVADPQTAGEIAQSEGVSERTVRNNAVRAAAIDAVKEVAPTVAAAVLAGNVKASTKDLEALAELPKRDAKEVDRVIAAGEATSVKSALASLEPDEEEEGEEIDPDSLETVQADLRDFEKRIREVARLGRKVLAADGNEITRPWCSRYTLLALIHPIQQVARTVLNDLPVGGKADDPKLHREEVAEKAG